MKKKSAQAKAKAKALRSSSLMLLLSFALLLGSISFAWFSKNLQTESSGMQMSAGATPNLIIGTSADAVTSPNRNLDLFKVTWTTAKTNMLCCTHGNKDATAAAPYLKYVTNTVDVGLKTGLAATNKTLTFENVTASAPSDYYVDFVVYLGSMDLALENVTLKATLTGSRSDGKNLTSTQLASSIDFYINTTDTALGTYAGTLNAAGKDSTQTNGTEKTEVTLLDTGSTIPCCTDGTAPDYYVITMRCYFDGALQNGDSTNNVAYINTYSVDTSALSLSVFFTAEEISTNS